MLNVATIWMPEHQQQTFRAILEAMSRPGSVYAINHDQQSNTLTAVLATLMDGTVSLADADALIAATDWPMLQAKPGSTENADFIVCNGLSQPDITPKLGTLESPEQSATVILKVASLSQGDVTASLSGPGVNGKREIAILGLHPDWIVMRQDWICEFPLGVDLLLIDDNGLMALPRTTKIEVN